MKDVLALLIDGRVVRHFVTIPEGWSSAQAVDILMNEDDPDRHGRGVPEEGSLWPETYEVTRGETRASVIARMQRAQQDEAWPNCGPGAARPAWSGRRRRP